jgi:hypothetical protein
MGDTNKMNLERWPVDLFLWTNGHQRVIAERLEDVPQILLRDLNIVASPLTSWRRIHDDAVITVYYEDAPVGHETVTKTALEWADAPPLGSHGFGPQVLSADDHEW